MRQLSIKEIQPGMIVGQPVEDSAGRILLKPGDTIKDVYIQLLSKRGIQKIFIRDEASPEVHVETSHDVIRLTEEEIKEFHDALDARFALHEDSKNMNIIKKLAGKHGLKRLELQKAKGNKPDKNGK